LTWDKAAQIKIQSLYFNQQTTLQNYQRPSPTTSVSIVNC